MKRNSFSAEEERVVQSLEEAAQGAIYSSVCNSEVSALVVSEHLAHPGFFSLQPGDLSFLNFKANSDCYRVKG